MELSLLCEVKVMLCVMDKNDRMIVYASDEDTANTMQSFILNDSVQKEFLSNSDVNRIKLIVNFSIKNFFLRAQRMKLIQTEVVR